MRANLHIHTKYSDGKQWPEKVVLRAKKINLEMISCTDHDTLAGVPEFIEACEAHSIKGVAGVEIDCVGKFYWGDKAQEKTYNGEILGYFPNNHYEKTMKLLNPMIEQRKNKMKHYIKRMADICHRFDLTWDDFLTYRFGKEFDLERVNKATLMKPHLYNYLKHKRLPEIYKMEYKTFRGKFFKQPSCLNLEEGLNKDNSKCLSLEEVISSIQADGGYAVIPHPALQFICDDKKTKSEDVISYLRQLEPKYTGFFEYCHELGVWGIEMYYYNQYKHNPYIITQLNEIMKKFAHDKFHFTWGSDCHGIGSSSDAIEKFEGNFSGFE